LKAIQFDPADSDELSSKSHWRILERTWRNYSSTGDIRVGWAVLGAELTYRGQFMPQHLDYLNPLMQEIMDRYRPKIAFSGAMLAKEIRKQRLLNFGFLSSNQRRRVLRFLYRRRRP
jgi:hypothetical protein